MRFLVTGGAGFIGSNLVIELVNRGEDVVVVDDLSLGDLKNLDEVKNKIRFVKGSILDFNLLKKEFSGIDYVFHLAAIPSVPRSIANPLDSNLVNIVGTLNVLQAAKDSGVNRVVYSASSSRYGDSTFGLKQENSPINFLSPYALQKYVGEHYASLFYKFYGLEVVSLIFFNVFGPRQNPDSPYSAVIPKFIKLMLKGDQPVIYGDGQTSRDFTYVDNNINALIKACTATDVCGQAFNIACGQSVSLLELVEKVNQILGTNIKPLLEDFRPGDIKYSLADISLARQKLGYEVKVDFDEGLKKTIDYLRKQEMQVSKVCIVGLGYVGLPLAALLSTKYKVIAFDINSHRIEQLKAGHDYTGEVANIGDYKLEYTADPQDIKEADFIIVTVPTPIDKAKNPDLYPIKSATELVGRNLKRGAVVVYESTVYPGCTEEICVPILERESGLKFNQDFKVGYSPERVNPGDKEHTIDKIVKVVSGSDEDTLNRVASLYGSIITAGIHKASSIKVAEASKVIENVKRDLNIALVNELSLIFDRVGIDTMEVLEAASTKWNFNQGNFFPGLVGGHCIGVDPYYLTHKALELGYHPQIILAGRSTNEYMSRHVAELVIKNLSRAGKVLKDSKVLIMGLTFKENVPDTRNSKISDVINHLKDFEIIVGGYEPLLSDSEVTTEFGLVNINLVNTTEKFDAVIVFSPHQIFKNISLDDLKVKMNSDPILIDIKRFYNRQEAEQKGFIYKFL